MLVSVAQRVVHYTEDLRGAAGLRPNPRGFANHCYLVQKQFNFFAG